MWKKWRILYFQIKITSIAHFCFYDLSTPHKPFYKCHTHVREPIFPQNLTSPHPSIITIIILFLSTSFSSHPVLPYFPICPADKPKLKR